MYHTADGGFQLVLLPFHRPSAGCTRLQSSWHISGRTNLDVRLRSEAYTNIYMSFELRRAMSRPRVNWDNHSRLESHIKQGRDALCPLGFVDLLLLHYWPPENDMQRDRCAGTESIKIMKICTDEVIYIFLLRRSERSVQP